MEDAAEGIVLATEKYDGAEPVNLGSEKEITIKADNSEQLLYKFLDEIIYLLDADKFIVAKAKVQIANNELSALLEGDSTLNYKDLDHVKAATYAEMYIKENLKGWEAQVVLDV